MPALLLAPGLTAPAEAAPPAPKPSATKKPRPAHPRATPTPSPTPFPTPRATATRTAPVATSAPITVRATATAAAPAVRRTGPEATARALPRAELSTSASPGPSATPAGVERVPKSDPEGLGGVAPVARSIARVATTDPQLPIAVLVVVAAFLLLQNRIDRRDPKLAAGASGGAAELDFEEPADWP